MSFKDLFHYKVIEIGAISTALADIVADDEASIYVAIGEYFKDHAPQGYGTRLIMLPFYDKRTDKWTATLKRSANCD